jgi:hypothetical protein
MHLIFFFLFFFSKEDYSFATQFGHGFSFFWLLVLCFTKKCFHLPPCMIVGIFYFHVFFGLA